MEPRLGQAYKHSLSRNSPTVVGQETVFEARSKMNIVKINYIKMDFNRFTALRGRAWMSVYASGS